MRSGLTRRQQAFLDYIVDFIRQHQRSPSVSELADGLQRSRSSVSEMLDRLENRGFLVHGRFGPHGFLIAPANDDPTDFTYVIGRLFASGVARLVEPKGITFRVDAEWHAELQVGLTLDTPRPEDLFFLIAAEPMPELAILEGDLLLFERRRSVAPDDTVLFEVQGEQVDEGSSAPLYYVAVHFGIADQEVITTTQTRSGVDPNEFIDRNFHFPQDLPDRVAALSPDGAYVVKALTEHAAASPEYRQFAYTARFRPERVQPKATQIGLFRLTSYWQRTVRRAPV